MFVDGLGFRMAWFIVYMYVYNVKYDTAYQSVNLTASPVLCLTPVTHASKKLFRLIDYQIWSLNKHF